MRRAHLLPTGLALMGIAVALVGTRGLGRAPRAAHSSFGKGPAVALVHGLGSGPEQWLGAARQLVREHHVVFVDPNRRAAFAPQFVADAVHHRLAQVGLECARTAHIKVINPFERFEERVLDQIVRVGQIAGPRWQSSSRPPLQGTKMTAKQLIHRIGVALARTREQAEGRFDGRVGWVPRGEP